MIQGGDLDNLKGTSKWVRSPFWIIFLRFPVTPASPVDDISKTRISFWSTIGGDVSFLLEKTSQERETDLTPQFWLVD